MSSPGSLLGAAAESQPQQLLSFVYRIIGPLEWYSVVFQPLGPFLGRHLLKRRMHLQNDVLELFQLLGRFLFDENGGGDLATEFV